MTEFKIGDIVKLLVSNNSYTPVGSLLTVENISNDNNILHVSVKGNKYVVHVDHVKLFIFSKEKVTFT